MNQRPALWGVEKNYLTGLWDVFKLVKKNKVLMDEGFESFDEAVTRRGEMQAQEQGVPFEGVGPKWSEEMIERGRQKLIEKLS